MKNRTNPHAQGSGAISEYGKTSVMLCANYDHLGAVAAEHVSARMQELLATKQSIRVVFAAGESQGSFLDALATMGGIDWTRVDCFNIDDFWDPRMPERYTCGYQTAAQLYSKVKPRSVNLVNFNAMDPQAECDRFEALLRSASIDILCQGIGTSGHLALNEPDVCDFNDKRWVRLVDVAEQSKRQLRADPNFKELGYIPEHGITMTLPAICSANACYTIVPLALKKPILTRLAAAMQPTTGLPASILCVRDGKLFVDQDSCPDVWLPQLRQLPERIRA